MDPWKELERLKANAASLAHTISDCAALKDIEAAKRYTAQWQEQADAVGALKARMAACYEACEGIEDPKRSIVNARVTLGAAIAFLEETPAHDGAHFSAVLEDALVALTPKTESEAGDGQG